MPFVRKKTLLSSFCIGLFAVIVFSSSCPALQPEGEVIIDAGAAGLVQLSQLDTALRNSVRSTADTLLYNTKETGRDLMVGGGIGYTSQSVDADGDIDFDGVSGLVTLSYHKSGSPVLYGAFGELFDGDYDTYRVISTGEEASSNGSLESYGAGLFAHYRPGLSKELPFGASGVWIPGMYLDAALRVGHGKMEFKTPNPVPFKFNVSGVYYGASAGGGYVFNVSPKVDVDVYGRLIWTAMGSMDAGTCQDKGVYLERAHSVRFMSGFRAGYRTKNERVRPYVGLALDWELMDGPEVYYECVQVGDSDISGVSGLIEMGVDWQADDDVFINLNAMGSVGQRDSFGATLEVKYRF